MRLRVLRHGRGDIDAWGVRGVFLHITLLRCRRRELLFFVALDFHVRVGGWCATHCVSWRLDDSAGVAIEMVRVCALLRWVDHGLAQGKRLVP